MSKATAVTGSAPSPPDTMNHLAARVLGGCVATLGGALLIRPELIARRVAASGAVAPASVVGILGLRCAVQGGLVSVLPRRRVLIAAVAIDTAHCASMLALAALDARYRHSALISGLVAAATAVAESLCAARLAH